MEGVNKEIKRRTDVVGVFPNPATLLRLACCVLIEVHDEWQVSERRYLSESSMALIDATATKDKTPPITREMATTELIASWLEQTREAAHSNAGSYTTQSPTRGHSGDTKGSREAVRHQQC